MRQINVPGRVVSNPDLPRAVALSLILLFGASGCGGAPSATSSGSDGGSAGNAATAGAGSTGPNPYLSALVLNEISSNNDGNAVDEFGNADDWVELVNRGADPIDLGDLVLETDGERVALPPLALSPGSRVVFWADATPTQGPMHLPLQFKSSGFRLTLRRGESILSRLEVPKLETNDVFARFPDVVGSPRICRYATPKRDNGQICGPPTPPPMDDTVQFTPYSWSLPYPEVPATLTIDELALRPAKFIELLNNGPSTLSLSDYQLRLAPIAPGVPWPTIDDGIALDLPSGEALAPGQRLVVPVLESDVASIASVPQFEGVATLFGADATVVDRVDFVRWPEGAALARTSRYPGRHVFCAPTSPGADNDACSILERRDVGDYVRHLRTLGDFAALTAGGGELGMASTKIIVDMAAGNQVYLVGWRDWSLHYEFIREVINHEPHLNRCVSADNALFETGWYYFSVTEYFRSTGRRYLLGTLVHHAASDLHTVEFTFGDEILAEDMRKAFFLAAAHVLSPEQLFIRPQDSSQVERARQIEGTVPLVGPNAPFRENQLQPLTAGIGYGVLTYIPSNELGQANLGPDVVVITDAVPNDIPLVGGLVTEAFQTPLSHVNVLCQNRGTPNLALPNAHEHKSIAPLLGQLVRFEVTGDGFHIGPAPAEEAQAFWDSKKPSTALLAPRLDPERGGIVDLQKASLADLPAIGAKAAQLAELVQVASSGENACGNVQPFAVPSPAFAVPVRYFLEHLQRSGASKLLETLIGDPETSAKRDLRHERLAEIRRTILNSDVDPQFLGELTQLLRQNYGSARVRLRSSSNAEDLPGFNGAGLYSSVSAAVDDPDYPIEGALRQVWASLFSDRGYDERAYMNVDQLQVAMGVLIHPAFPEERVNGVIISRNMDDITRGDQYTFNIQLGESSVTNPAPGVTSDLFIFQWPPRTPMVSYKSFSSFNDSKPILSDDEVTTAACAMATIVGHFRPLLDPKSSDPYFTMDLEMKLLGDERRLLVKQARPYVFGSWKNPGDCREF